MIKPTRACLHRRLARVCARTPAALAACVPLAGCSTGVLAPVGPVGGGDRLILLDSLAIMLAIVLPTIGATLAFAWWFRAGNARARRRPDFIYSGRLELLVWSIPALTVLFLSGVAWVSSHELDPAKPLASAVKPLRVQVVSLDWKWLFIYPDQGVASVNRMVVPTGTPLQLELTSASVMNVFFAPRLGSQIYTMNGMRTQLNLQADRPGTYPGLSAHFSGDGFSDMAFQVEAVPAPRFQTWAAQVKQATTAPALDDDAYRALSKQGSIARPFTYRDARVGLFEAVVRQELPPSEGPRVGRASAAVSPKTGG